MKVLEEGGITIEGILIIIALLCVSSLTAGVIRENAKLPKNTIGVTHHP